MAKRRWFERVKENQDVNPAYVCPGCSILRSCGDILEDLDWYNENWPGRLTAEQQAELKRNVESIAFIIQASEGGEAQ